MKTRIKKNITITNTITSILLQLLTIANGFIIPKIILSYFGSEVNGLISSLNQFLSYISLVEGGLTGVIMASLYKPLLDKNLEKVSSIMNTANKFYKKIGMIFVIYSLILASLYPIVFNTSFNYLYVFLLTIILSLNLFIQYMFSISLKTLLNADKKVYIVSLTQIVIIISNITLSILSVKIFPNVHLLKLINALIYAIQPLVYNNIIKKEYNLNKNAKLDNKLIKNRWNGFAVVIAAFIHYSTDVTLLSVFTTFSIVSVYSVHGLVTNGLRQLVNSISNAVSPSLGKIYASGNRKRINDNFELYELIMFIIVFFIFSLAILLIESFIQLYTKNINDISYNQPLFSVLLLLSELLYLIKYPHLNLSYAANKFKEIKLHCFIEAGLNILFSLIFIFKYGLVGVTIGTIIGMTYRMVYQVYFTKKIINRPQNIFYKKLLLFSICSIIGVIISKSLFPMENITAISWIWHGIIYSVILSIIYLPMIFFFYKEDLIKIKRKIIK